MKAPVSLIYARARNGVIGANGGIPWRLNSDMSYFRRMTIGGVVIMGRKTFESLTGPLPGRVNIVLTRHASLKKADGVIYVNSIEAALDMAWRVAENLRSDSHVWVIGGAKIYKAAMPFADFVLITEIDFDYEGDTFAPDLGKEWVETYRKAFPNEVIPHSFVQYKRRTGSFKKWVGLAGVGAIKGLLAGLLVSSPVVLTYNLPSAINIATVALFILAMIGALSVVDAATSLVKLRKKLPIMNK